MTTRRACLYLSVLFLLLCSPGFARDADPPTELDVHRLIQQLTSDDWILQSEALQRLGRWEIDKAAPAIEKLLAEENAPWLRGQALVALTRIRGEVMLPVVQRFLQEKEATLRKAGFEALDIIATQPAAAAALNLLGDTDAEIRAMAAAICASHYPKETWPVVKALSDQTDAAASVYLFRALAAIGSADALVQVEKLFEAAGSNEELRYQIFRGLREADETAVPLLVRLTARYKPEHRTFQFGRNILATHDKQHVAAALQTVFASQQTELYAMAAVLAADVCPCKELEDAIAATWSKHKDLPPETVRAGIVALTKIDPSRHTAMFRRYLDDKDAATRARAVRCRGLCDKQNLFDEFRTHVSDADHRVARAALESLLHVPEDVLPAQPVVDYLAAPLRSDNREVLLAALKLAGSRRTRSATTEAEFRKVLDVLEPHLGGANDELRVASADALVKLGGVEKTAAVVAAQGFISHWKVIGTFLNDQKNTGFATVYPPEKEIDFSKTYESEYRWEFGGAMPNELQKLQVKWVDVQLPKVDGTINIAAAMPAPTRYAVAYAVADLHSDKEQAVLAMIEQESKIRLWVNGKKVTETPAIEPPAPPRDVLAPKPTVESEPCKIALKKGSNRILVKTASQGKGWWIRIRLLDEKTNRKATGVKQAAM